MTLELDKGARLAPHGDPFSVYLAGDPLGWAIRRLQLRQGAEDALLEARHGRDFLDDVKALRAEVDRRMMDALLYGVEEPSRGLRRARGADA